MEKRSASISINQTDETSLRDAVKRVEAMARLAPEDPEFLPPGRAGNLFLPADLVRGDRGDDSGGRPRETASGDRGGAGREGRERGVFHEESQSLGLRQQPRGVPLRPQHHGRILHDRPHRAGTGLGLGEPRGHRRGRARSRPVGERAIRKALDSREAKARPAGRTTVVFEAAAARDLVGLLSWGLDRRGFDEGRSFLNGLVAEGEDPVGKALFGDRATVYSDPMDAGAPCGSHSGGLPLAKTTWIEKGVLKALPVGAFGPGKRNSRRPRARKPDLSRRRPFPRRTHCGSGGRRPRDAPLVSPDGAAADASLHGLTRDGTFAIREGKVAGPVNNYRFNETPVNVLKNLVSSGVPERVLGSESQTPMRVPALVVKDFNLSSVSDAS